MARMEIEEKIQQKEKNMAPAKSPGGNGIYPGPSLQGGSHNCPQSEENGRNKAYRGLFSCRGMIEENLNCSGNFIALPVLLITHNYDVFIYQN